MEYFLSDWRPIIIPLGIILISLLVVSIVILRKNRALAEKLCFYILGFTILYKAFDYVIYCVMFKHAWNAQIPVEISQLAYFVCPLACFSRNKWIRDGGAFTGIIAGGMQLIAIIVAPQQFARTGLDVYAFFESTILHYFVLWGGLVQICCIEQMKVKNLWRNYLMFLIILLWGVLASYTWMFGTDYGHPNEPANIGFTQRADMLPASLLEKYPWLQEGHWFLIPYLALFFILTAGLYLLSYLCFKNKPEQQPSIYGLGFRGFREFMTSNSVAKAYDDVSKDDKK